MQDNEESTPCLELRNLVKHFGDVVAVNYINLKVAEGDVFSLLGPSGCGKTTTLRIIAGLESADAGELLIEGRVVNHVPPYKRDCNLVFQNHALFPHMTVQENIAYGLERKKCPKAEIKAKVFEMIEFMQLQGMESRYPVQLSGGQQQRVALARSLVLRPKILLLDEPLAALDRKLRKDMQGELKRIQEEVGITFFHVTHDQKISLAISDSIAVMRDGKLEQVGSPEEIYDTPRTRFVADFIGATNIFAGRVIARGAEDIQLESENGLKIIARADSALDSTDVTGVCVHPERIGILPADAEVEADNRFQGRIVEMIYQGDFMETKIRLTNGRTHADLIANLDIRQHRKTGFSVGQAVIVNWDRDSSNILQG